MSEVKLVHMSRLVPELAGQPTEMDVRENDVDVLLKRGWTVSAVAKAAEKENLAKKESGKETEKDNLLDSSGKKNKAYKKA